MTTRIWRRAAPAEDRFWAKVDKTPGQGPGGDCWRWLAGTSAGGYGRLDIGGKNVRVHRFSYELHHGPIPDGLQVRHTCDNPPCPNPDHLLLGTVQDNHDDMVARGRSLKGNIHNAKLTLDDVLVIRCDMRPFRQIAVDYSVSKSTIGHIKSGLCWGYVQEATT